MIHYSDEIHNDTLDANARTKVFFCNGLDLMVITASLSNCCLPLCQGIQQQYNKIMDTTTTTTAKFVVLQYMQYCFYMLFLLTDSVHCLSGTYCPEGSERPTLCDLGQYCEHHALDATSGPCSAGYFCNGSAEVTDPQPCSTGHYCPEGTDMEMPCPAGTYAGLSCALTTNRQYCTFLDAAYLDTSQHCS